MSKQFFPLRDSRELSSHGPLKFYTPLSMLFVALFIVVNIVAQKIVPLGKNGLLTAGDFVYPLLYCVSIIVVEVYGYALSRRVIWGAFFCNLLVAIIIALTITLPSADLWHEQEAFRAILGRTPRLLGASLGAFLIGEFLGSYLLAKIKILTSGKYLWLRTAGTTLLGQLVDSFIFTTIAFMGIVSPREILTLALAAYGCKIICQVVLTPVLYWLANFLKRQENLDIFDHHTNFNPFNLRLK
jgi:hypothetical protein